MLVAFPAFAMWHLHLVMREHGVTMTTTGRGRSGQSQWDIFGGRFKRYRPCSIDEYNAAKRLKRAALWRPTERALAIARLGAQQFAVPDATYWCKIQNQNGSWPYNAAVPFTSRHGDWCADDIAEIVDTRRVALRRSTALLLWEIAPTYGWAWQTAADPPHVHWIAGDSIPPALEGIVKRLIQPVDYSTVPPQPSTAHFTLGEKVQWISDGNVLNALAVTGRIPFQNSASGRIPLPAEHFDLRALRGEILEGPVPTPAPLPGAPLNITAAHFLAHHP